MRKEVKIGMGVGLILICAASLYFFAKPQPDTAEQLKIGLPDPQENAAGAAGFRPAKTSPSGLDTAEKANVSPLRPSPDEPAISTSADVPVTATMIAVPTESAKLPLAKDEGLAVAPDPVKSPKVKEEIAPPPSQVAKRADKPVPAKSPPAGKNVRAIRPQTFHAVAAGESFYTIARDHYGDPGKYKLISAANPTVNPKAVPVGYRLILPAEKPKAAVLPTSSPNRYTVRPGDTLIGIAQRLFGDQKHFKAIYEANKTQFPQGPDHLKSGLVLVLPSDLERVDKSTGW